MLGFTIEKRQEPLKWGSFFIFLVALVFSLGVSGLLLAIQGKPPLEAMYLLWDGAFAHDWALEDTVLKAIPIFLCSLGVAVCFRMQIWNIGAEGQYALGAVGATWVVLSMPDAPMWALLPLMFLAAAVLGGLWAIIPALLREKMGLNEIISTLMFNYIGILFLEFLVYGAWKDPASFGFPMTIMFPDTAIIGEFFGRIHWGILVCAGAAAALTVFLKHTRLGFEIMVSGENPRAARYARMPYSALVVLVMGICGALAGWAGLIETSATLNRLQPTIMVGYGFTAIVVAWLARLRITSIAGYSILLAGLRVGVENLQLELQVPASFTGIMQGLILLSVLAGQFFNWYSFQRSKRG
ncbi:ABC transporter permease [Halodesulfovibrio marinisediminis]|uniref:Nucleoside ABC transporter membrane protein n=1 Tax=Halodesulfovibrio marinisediminis DSM 17456 TaxID=1121457 RepID=A0A1N6IBI6_9BACT|nr:ABC transporter permease [Halodesulfovibrio marinisediminis]SIO29374.1 nucleoside ABC transporter membrane protein [Halodesulfovibrio marinisediminis DSM 17456]